MSDAVECKDQVAPPVYTRSLLYLVSGILEAERDKPILGMQRYFTSGAYDDDPSVVAVRTYFRARENWDVWSLTASGALAGLVSNSTSHGDFDNEPTTLESLGAIVRGWSPPLTPAAPPQTPAS